MEPQQPNEKINNMAAHGILKKNYIVLGQTVQTQEGAWKRIVNNKFTDRENCG